MTIYEEIYYQLPDLMKFYRFEGGASFPYFSFNEKGAYIANGMKYIYFSRSIKHHEYYVKKRLQQLINKDILAETGLTLKKNILLNSDLFKEITKIIENCPLEDRLISIECSTSHIFKNLIKKNYISNKHKSNCDRRIEFVDSSKHQGGYGFCGEWLGIFNLLTYFYSYQRITKDNILDFLYAYRQNLIKSSLKINPTSFLLNPKNRVIKINENLYHDFRKYELMNSLQSIVEKELYFEQSILENNPYEQIKSIIQDYCDEKEYILELTEREYQKSLIKN